MSHNIVLYTLNVGNTHTSLLAWSGRARSRPHVLRVWRTGERLKSIRSLFSSRAPAVLAGVVPAYRRVVMKTLKAAGANVLLFRKEIRPCIEIVPKPGANVGDDRIAAALGALALNPARPVVVVDVGTALTINAVTPGNARKPPRFEGGLIVPGARIGLWALSQFTAQLPDIDLKRLDAQGYIGRSTRQAIGLGVRHAEISAAVELARGQVRELGKGTRVMLTGGGVSPEFRSAFVKAFGRAASFDPHLVHRGLFQAWRVH